MNFPNKKYNIIYADPAWSYKDKRDKHPRISGGASVHYNTMSVDEIKKLPVNEIADKNCMLFLWTTFPNLQEGLDVVKAWGFDYRTLGFSWIKLNKKNRKAFFGIGYYTKSNCECCLIGVKGKPIIVSNKVSSVVLSTRLNHSKKPPIIRDKIIELVGDLPRIELFARTKVHGWDVWGNDEKLESIPLESWF